MEDTVNPHEPGKLAALGQGPMQQIRLHGLAILELPSFFFIQLPLGQESIAPHAMESIVSSQPERG